MDNSSSLIDELVRHARTVSRCAYAPYSNFPVGAAVLTADGTVHTGANVENAAYGLAICAERSAIFQAIAQGATRISAVAIYTPTAAATPPCGACRQVMAEFGTDVLVICCCDDASAERRYRLTELLPVPFGPGQL